MITAPAGDSARRCAKALVLAALTAALAGLAAPAPAAADPTAGEPPTPAPTTTEPDTSYHSVVEAATLLTAGLGARHELDADRLAAKGAHDLAQALAGEPGARVSVAPVAGSANSKQEHLLSLRGFDPGDVLVLVDGAPVGDPDSGVVDLAQYPLDGVRRVIVVRGPSSLLYGPGALAGVVHLVTGDGPGAGSARWSVEAEPSGAFAARTAAGLRAGPAWGGFAASLRDTPGFPVAAGFEPQRNEDGGLRANSDRRDVSLRARGTTRRGPLRLLGGAALSDHAGGVPYSVADPAPSTLWRRTWRREAADLGAELDVGPRLRVRGHVYAAHQHDTLATYSDTSFDTILADGDGVSTHDGFRVGWLLAPRWRIAPGAEVTLGAHHRLDLVQRQSERGGPWEPFRSETGSLALEARVRPLDWLRLQGGASGVAFFKEQAGGTTPGEDLLDWEALVGAVVALPGAMALRLAGARKVGFPTFKRLYGTYGNPDLRTQRARLLELGLESGPWLDGAVSVEVSLFRADVDDLVGRGGTPNTIRFDNIDQARLQGVELSATLRPAAWVEVTAGYTWLDAVELGAGEPRPRLDYRPAHTGQLGLGGVLPWTGTRWSVRYGLVSERSVANEVPTESPTASTPARLHLPWYGLTDAHLQQPIALGNAGELHVGLWGHNLGDAYYEASPGRPAPGRRVVVGLGGRLP